MRNHIHRRATSIFVAAMCVLGTAGAGLAVEQQQLDAFTRDALNRAIEDTSVSREFYSAVIARHGKVDPFVGVLEGEERQEEALRALAKSNDVAVAPQPTKAPEVPTNVKDACSTAVLLEKHSVAMYDEMMANVKNSAIRKNFENYRETAAAHQLPAFERCVTRGGGTPPVANSEPRAASNGGVDRCESCGMVGCPCSAGVGAPEAGSAEQEGATAGESGTKPHTCGCMRGRSQ